METATAKWAWWAASVLRWLTGPIFDKEMRVSSRRRRNYVLRFVYIGLFTFLAAALWIDRVANTTTSGYTSVYQVSRMAAAGQTIITAVLWFQFLTCQVIAIVMLSTSISDEIYKRTLGTLLTTPIGSFQIVIGKLTSKLLQIVLLLAISLPLLAVVRVFGGVPWGFLLCGLCVTLTAVIFVGSLSLFFSIFTRRAYAAILEAILATGLLFLLVPMIAGILYVDPPVRVQTVLYYLNPYMTMGIATMSLYSVNTPVLVSWPLHCAIMLGASSLLLLLAMVFVRKAALRQAGGISDRRFRIADSSRGANPKSAIINPQSSIIRRVVGPPVLWKERRIPLLGKRKIATIITVIFVLGLLLLTYGFYFQEKMLVEQDTHVAYTVVFLGVGLLFTMVLPATCITTERESQTWPLLLTTTVGTWEILWGKFVGAMRRCLPAWLALFAHVVVFVAVGIIHPIAIIQLGVLIAWTLLFLTSTGLYFSARLRHTTAAVIANMALAAGLWAVLPLFLVITLGMAGVSTLVLEVYMDMNPFVQAGVVMSAAAHKGGLGTYDWIRGGMSSLPDATGWLALTFVVYVSVGLIFVARAASRLRRNPF